MGLTACWLGRRWGCSAQLGPALELDDVKKSKNVVEKEKREPENDNSNDEFADIETAAAFWIHSSPTFRGW
jgi:hypothetical protein